MIVLGINNMHDASAALVHDGKVVAAAEEERFVRRKHVSGFPVHAIRFCLQEAGVSIREIDHVGASWKYWVLRRRAFEALKTLPTSLMTFRAKAQRGMGQMRHEWYQLFRMRRLIEDHFGKGRFKLHYVDHHFCHAVSAFHASPYERAAILTIDGAGEEATTMYAVGEGKRIESIKQIRLPHSLGQFYAALTGFLGFKMQADEYKVMGLASYGKPSYVDYMQNHLLMLRPEGEFRLNANDLDYHLARQGIFLPALTKVLGRNRRSDEPVEARHQEVAASAQKALESVILNMADYMHGVTKLDKLCIAGGVGFNCVANGRLLTESPFESVFVQPAAGDAGTALGAALHLDRRHNGTDRDYVMDHAYLGPRFSKQQCLTALKESRLEFSDLSEEVLCARVAQLLSEGKLVFWFQGRMEWGPRALGNRSLLADPRREEMKDIINLKIKQRENFRPFAPAVLEEKSYEYFGNPGPTPFMLFTFDVKPEKRSILPAITHVDGTARPQTVNRNANPRFWKLIKEFEKITQVPVLLNTSFNVQEPIVCRPEEAVDCFLRTRADYLVMDTILAHRPPE